MQLESRNYCEFSFKYLARSLCSLDFYLVLSALWGNMTFYFTLRYVFYFTCEILRLPFQLQIGSFSLFVSGNYLNISGKMTIWPCRLYMRIFTQRGSFLDRLFQCYLTTVTFWLVNTWVCKSEWPLLLLSIERHERFLSPNDVLNELISQFIFVNRVWNSVRRVLAKRQSDRWSI